MPRKGQIMPKIPLKERFERHIYYEPNTGCWLWGAYIMPIDKRGCGGYGTFATTPDRNSLAHRFSYEIYKGEIPKGLDVDHLCRVRSCVNPDHLEPTTRKENLRRGNTNGGKTHCKRGHPLAEENLWMEKNGYRHCKTCHYNNQKNRLERLKLLKKSHK